MLKKLNRKPFDSVRETSRRKGKKNLETLNLLACVVLGEQLIFTGMPANIFFSATFPVEEAQSQPAHQNTGRRLRNC